MGPIGERVPKALLPLGRDPLIIHHLRAMEGLGITRALVVVGHHGPAIAAAVGSRTDLGLRVTFVEQPAALGTAHAVGLLAPHTGDALVVCVLGDYAFSAPDLPRVIDRVAATPRSAAIAVRREKRVERLREGSAVEVDGEGRVVRITEKPWSPRSHLRGCGMYVLPPEAVQEARHAPRTALRDEHELATAIQRFIDAGGTVFAEEVIEWEAPFTRPADVLRHNLAWLDREGLPCYVGPGALLAEGTVVRRSVVGAGAVVTRPTALRDSVVLPGARLEGGGAVERTVVAAGDRRVLCAPADLEE
jgi:glucose-1-phosphate thymidylyltransferase